MEIDPEQGVLRAARARLDQPQDPVRVQVSNRLARGFALQGRGFFRRMPALLEVELALHLANMEKICRSHDELAGRLLLAQAMLLLFHRSPEFCGPNFCQLALRSP